MKGFSTRNLKYMGKFSEEYPGSEFVQQVVAQLPWGHVVLLMDLVPSPEDRLFYMKKVIEYGWSRSVLVLQIEAALHKREGKAVTNF
jgi:predicted nuclease of restriction endonuclease-like (RecB) superfamily